MLHYLEDNTLKLKQYHVRNFKCVLDSGEIDVDDHITCFVGKNESGKTALLEALRNTSLTFPQKLVKLQD